MKSIRYDKFCFVLLFFFAQILVYVSFMEIALGVRTFDTKVPKCLLLVFHFDLLKSKRKYLCIDDE